FKPRRSTASRSRPEAGTTASTSGASARSGTGRSSGSAARNGTSAATGTRRSGSGTARATSPTSASRRCSAWRRTRATACTPRARSASTTSRGRTSRPASSSAPISSSVTTSAPATASATRASTTSASACSTSRTPASSTPIPGSTSGSCGSSTTSSNPVERVVHAVLLHGEGRRKLRRPARRVGDHVAEDQRAVRDAPFAAALLEPVQVARRRRLALAAPEALQHEDVGLDQGAVRGAELDQHVGVEVHRVLLLRVQARDVREEGVGRPLEEAVVVERIVVVERAREGPVLPVHGAREALQAVLDRDAGRELLDERAEEPHGSG